MMIGKYISLFRTLMGSVHRFSQFLRLVGTSYQNPNFDNFPFGCRGLQLSTTINSLQVLSKLKVHRCPLCGAPIQVDPSHKTVLCVYCDAPIAIHHGAQGKYDLIEDQILGREAAAEIKRLLASGQKAQAIALYAQRTGLSSAEATQTVTNLSKDMHYDLFFASTLNVLGVVFMLMFLSLICVGIWLLKINPVLGVVSILFGVGWFLLFCRQFVRTIQYVKSAKIGEAEVLHHALLSRVEDIQIVRLDLLVRGPNGDTFEVETHLKVKETALHKIQSGQILQVKYLAGQPESVLYGRGLKSSIVS